MLPSTYNATFLAAAKHITTVAVAGTRRRSRGRHHTREIR